MSTPDAHLDVRLTPRSSRNRLELQPDGSLKVWVTAAPTDNQANECLCRYLAERLRIGRSHVSIVSGHANRNKRVSIAGLDQETVARLLSR